MCFGVICVKSNTQNNVEVQLLLLKCCSLCMSLVDFVKDVTFVAHVLAEIMDSALHRWSSVGLSCDKSCGSFFS